MKFKITYIIFINILLFIPLSLTQAYDYFGVYYGPEHTSMLYFKVVDKDSVTKTCFLTSPDYSIENLEANNFALTNQDFYYYAFSKKMVVDIQTKKESFYYNGGGPIDGFVGKTNIYKFDIETLHDLNKYCGTYYSIDKKDSIVINIKDSLSLITTHTKLNSQKQEVNLLYPVNSTLYISNSGLKYEFKLRNFIPWQIMFVSEGHDYFFYKEL
jgi:hypothetical protein